MGNHSSRELLGQLILKQNGAFIAACRIFVVFNPLKTRRAAPQAIGCSLDPPNPQPVAISCYMDATRLCEHRRTNFATAFGGPRHPRLAMASKVRCMDRTHRPQHLRRVPVVVGWCGGGEDGSGWPHAPLVYSHQGSQLDAWRMVSPGQGGAASIGQPVHSCATCHLTA